jgi:hypothetical protein
MRKYRPQEQWQALVDQQRDSGLSATQFCKQEDIGYAPSPPTCANRFGV